MLSNRLVDLAERVQDADRQATRADLDATSQAIIAGTILLEAKSLVKHGEWLHFLERSKIPDRRAQRLMQVASSGMDAKVVSALGGIVPAIAFLRDWTVNQPSSDRTLVVSSLLATEGDEVGPVGYVWEVGDRPGHYNAATICDDRVIVSKSSMPMAVAVEDDRPVPVVLHWLTVHLPTPISEWRLSRGPRGLIDALGLEPAGAA